jgi:CheY-like chemotaxis protein
MLSGGTSAPSNGNGTHRDSAADVELRPSTETVVLVAEDDADMAELYCQTLGLYGFLVVIAENGVKAVKLAEEIGPHAICLDIRMPELDGLGALEQIRTAGKTGRTPVLMISNFDEPELMERAGQLGAVRFLVKAETSPSQLAEILRDLLNLPERRKPGRLPVAVGAHPAHDAEQMIRAYRELLQTANTVLEELDSSSPELQRRQLAGYAAQFKAQLAYWHAVMQRSREITQNARGDASLPS